MKAQTPGEARRPGLADSARFLKSLVATPRLTGAVAPSGRALARAMAAAIGSPSHGLVVELGPGTGPVTRSLIETGLPPARLVLVEYDPGVLPHAGKPLRRRPRHPGRRLRPAADARGFRRPADRRRGLQPAAAQPAAASPHETDRRRLRADGACRECSCSSPMGFSRPFRATSAPIVIPPFARGRSCAICRRPLCGPIGSIRRAATLPEGR